MASATGPEYKPAAPCSAMRVSVAASSPMAKRSPGSIWPGARGNRPPGKNIAASAGI